MTASDPYRHPAGRGCATTATLLTAIVRKAGR